MSRARDRLQYPSSDGGRENDRAIQRDNTIMYGVVLLIAVIGVALAIVFWAL